jgi:glutathione S-transferase
MVKLIIGNKNYSSWSLRPWLFLTFNHLAFEEVRIPLYQETTDRVIAGYSEAGKVPVLQDGDLTVWDSLAICEYISEQYLAGEGWPEAVQDRAEARSCSAEMHSGFFEIRGKLPMNCRASGRRVPYTPALEKEVTRIDRIWSNYRHLHAPQGPWLFGRCCIADCMFAPVAVRFQTYGIMLSETATAYMKFILNTDQMQQWLAQAAAETETIASAEVGC